MQNRLAVLVVASIVGLAACTTVGSSPATVPPTTVSPSTTLTVPATTTTTTTTVVSSSTTLDRRAEIEAIFLDLERRRLQAILDQDEEAYRSVFANDGYRDEGMFIFQLGGIVDPSAVLFSVVDVYYDRLGCIAVGAIVDMSGATEKGGPGEVTDYVIELIAGSWGLSWTGSGWRCEGSHPFSP